MIPQVMGFGWMCVLFAACGAYYHELTQPRLIDVFRLLYYASRYDIRVHNSILRCRPYHRGCSMLTINAACLLFHVRI